MTAPKSHFQTILLIFLSTLILGGCVSIQKPVSLDTSNWGKNDTKIAILVNRLPTGYTYKAGSQGLLDIAINNATASDLTKHLESLDFSEFYVIRKEINDILSQKGVNTNLLDANYYLPELSKFDKEGNYATLDYSSLKSSLGVDQLLIIDVYQLGTTRNYYGFIPISAPMAIFSGTGQLINLSNNKILWHHKVSITNAVNGNWDEPTTYPGLTNAIYQTLNQGKSQLITPLKNN